jgi:hypothetical protein
MLSTKLLRGRALLGGFCAWALMSLTGCGGLKLVPVSGKVTLGDEPMKLGRICLFPDRSKGNDNNVACIGRLNDRGEYSITTAGVKGNVGGKGAPLGWYKVVFMNSNDMKSDLDDLVAKGKFNRKYTDDAKTPLAVEVVENPEPGRYDFKMTK